MIWTFLRRIALPCLVIASCTGGDSPGAPGSSTQRPNFVLILADDLGYGDLACFGNPDNRTPHLDRLAREGLKFTDFHSNGPMCSPTRAALLTGLYQHRFGRHFESALSSRDHADTGLPLDVPTLPKALREAGYATGMYGKWHLGYNPPYIPTNQGFDEFRGLLSGDGDHHSHINRSGGKDWWNGEISSNGPLRGQKTEVYEGGHRVPAIARWPGRIQPGTETNETTMTMDLLPTYLELAGVEPARHLDGHTLSSVLFEGKPMPDRGTFWRKGKDWAARKGEWKLVGCEPGTVSLYNLHEDIRETTDQSRQNPEIVKRLMAAFEAWEADVDKG